jgi:hypothetical protein
MNYIDFTIAVSLFLFFFVAVVYISTNYFTDISSLTKITEFRTISEGFLNILFESHGTPENWQENNDVEPVELGFMDYVYKIPVKIKEISNNSRIDDFVDVNLTFDKNCENITWNNTIRVFDSNLSEVAYNSYDEVYCNNQFLKHAMIYLKVNISANEIKQFYVYYSPDTSILTPNYSYLTFSNQNWIPNDRDSWTENNAAQWSCTRMTCSDENSDYKVGSYSIEAVCTDSSQFYLAEYDPIGIYNLTDFKKLQFWIKSNTTNEITLRLHTSAGDRFYRNITPSTSWTLIEFDIGPASSGWSTVGSPSWSSIDYFNFFYNAGVANTILVDEIYFIKGSLEIETYPVEKHDAISFSKINALKNLSYDQVMKTLGDYKFRIEVTGT